LLALCLIFNKKKRKEGGGGVEHWKCRFVNTFLLPFFFSKKKKESALEELSEIVGESSSNNIAKAENSGSRSFGEIKHTQENRTNVTSIQSATNGTTKQHDPNAINQMQPGDENRSKSDVKDFAGNRSYYEQFDLGIFKKLLLSKKKKKRLKKNVKPKVGADNPFNRKLKRKSTRLALQQMQKIQETESALPVLEAFLQKNNHVRHIRGKNVGLLEISDASNAQERNKFNGNLSIMHIDELGPVKTRSNNKFYLIAHTDKKKNRTLEFKAVSEQDRDFWLKGIQAHIQHEKSMIQYLEQTS
ncbi:hypothetical protein RFI_15976, partial [Reticulomyxa filosa]